jgi:hypothetical protein
MFVLSNSNIGFDFQSQLVAKTTPGLHLTCGKSCFVTYKFQRTIKAANISDKKNLPALSIVLQAI